MPMLRRSRTFKRAAKVAFEVDLWSDKIQEYVDCNKLRDQPLEELIIEETAVIPPPSPRVLELLNAEFKAFGWEIVRDINQQAVLVKRNDP